MISSQFSILNSKFSISCLVCFLLLGNFASAQRYELVPFGDFEQWTVRHIKESAIIGGNTRDIYVVAPNDTLSVNKVYNYSKTIWSSSNAYAVVMGVTKTSCSALPDKGPTGRCAKLITCYASCKVLGLVNIKVLASGTLYWGKMLEPISSVTNPYSYMDWGIPFTKRPTAILLDYKAVVPNTGKVVKGARTVDGYDPEEVMLILQNRWEDEKGNIHAKRVGTAFYHISKSSSGWVKNKRIPVIYGDARKSESYKPYMDLITGDKTLYALNSKGKRVPILEEGWGDASTPVTHAVMSISSGSMGAFKGALDNILWVDNVRLEY